VEKNAWKSFENVTTNFLINQKAENDRDMEAEFAQSYKAMWPKYVERCIS